MSVPAFASVILDVDSTLCGIEGIDWLATRRGEAVALRVKALTDRAMAGDIALDTVYGERLELVRPDRAAVSALAAEYERQLAPDARAVVARLLVAGVRVVLVSGGIREAILPVGAQLGINGADVHAVPIHFNADGTYGGFNAQSPLATSNGKAVIAAQLDLPRPVLAVGDGATDLAMRGQVDAFAAYTGFVEREAVVAQADKVLSSFDQLAELVLG